MEDIYLNSFEKVLRKFTVLYFKDSDNINNNTSEYLNKIFKEVIITQNIKETIDVFLNNKINIFIADINNAEIDKVNMLKKLKDLYPCLPKITILDNSTIKDTLDSLDFSISHIVLKPIDTQILLKEINKVYKNTISCKNNI